MTKNATQVAMDKLVSEYGKSGAVRMIKGMMTIRSRYGWHTKRDWMALPVSTKEQVERELISLGNRTRKRRLTKSEATADIATPEAVTQVEDIAPDTIRSQAI